MSARLVHVEKYIEGYRRLYPTSHVILIRSAVPDLLYRPTRTQYRWLTPAINVILTTCSTADNRRPEILLHIFSNGGCHNTLNLIRHFQEATSLPFPSHVKILDACPGRGTLKESINSVSASLPRPPLVRIALSVFLYLLMCVYWLSFAPFGIPDPIERIRQALNDEVLMKAEIRRGYVYSTRDTMVNWRDVEAHAVDAERRGYAVRKEKFGASEHCAHVRIGGGERYWAVVDSFWQGMEELSEE